MPNTNNDQIGKIGEIRFDFDCTVRNLFCAWPTVDKNGYDCIVDNGKSLVKVQIKTSGNKQENKGKPPYYKITVRRGKSNRDHYKKGDFDFVAVYLIPDDTWYFIPFEDCMDSCFHIIPTSEKSKWYKFKNNWDIIHNA